MILVQVKSMRKEVRLKGNLYAKYWVRPGRYTLYVANRLLGVVNLGEARVSGGMNDRRDLVIDCDEDSLAIDAEIQRELDKGPCRVVAKIEPHGLRAPATTPVEETIVMDVASFFKSVNMTGRFSDVAPLRPQRNSQLFVGGSYAGDLEVYEEEMGQKDRELRVSCDIQVERLIAESLLQGIRCEIRSKEREKEGTHA